MRVTAANHAGETRELHGFAKRCSGQPRCGHDTPRPILRQRLSRFPDPWRGGTCGLPESGRSEVRRPRLSCVSFLLSAPSPRRSQKARDILIPNPELPSISGSPSGPGP